jgi:hypothetical protein
MNAAVLTYNPVEVTGGQTVNIVFEFDDAAVADAIQGTVSIVPDASDPDIGDLRGIYFNLINLPMGVTNQDVLDAISGADITDFRTGDQLQGDAAITPIAAMDIALEIGTSGIGMGDDFLSTTFLIDQTLLASPLTLDNFAEVAVRVTSIGPPGGARSGSGKFLDEEPENGGGPSEIPEPGTYTLFASALAGLVMWRKFARH